MFISLVFAFIWRCVNTLRHCFPKTAFSANEKVHKISFSMLVLFVSPSYRIKLQIHFSYDKNACSSLSTRIWKGNECLYMLRWWSKIKRKQTNRIFNLYMETIWIIQEKRSRWMHTHTSVLKSEILRKWSDTDTQKKQRKTLLLYQIEISCWNLSATFFRFSLEMTKKLWLFEKFTCYE